MEELKNKYETLLKESIENPEIIGLFLGGSRGKDTNFVTKESDMDVYVILSDDASVYLKEKLKTYISEWFELRIFSLSEFSKYAEWGSKKVWDRYNFTHNKAIVDKNGEIQKMMDEKGKLPENVRENVIKEALDSYINQVYRSAKYWRDGRNFSSYLDATESLPFLMTALYALEGRLKPYNKYFEWELKNYPLKLLPWPIDEFIVDYKHILETGDIKTQEKIFRAIKKIFKEHGFEKFLDEWKLYYFVGK